MQTLNGSAESWEHTVSIGGLDNLVRARKHYALSLQQQCAPHNLRSVYGLVYACRAIVAAAEADQQQGSSSSSSSAADRYRTVL